MKAVVEGPVMAISPVVKGVYVCDDVLADPASGKISLLNVFITVRPTTAFPFELGKLCVLVNLRGGRGEAQVRVDVVQAATDRVIFRTSNRTVHFFDPLVSVYTRFRLERIQFPTAGRYVVEVYAENELLDDELITVLPTEEQHE
jgi:hypothetical protein